MAKIQRNAQVQQVMQQLSLNPNTGVMPLETEDKVQVTMSLPAEPIFADIASGSTGNNTSSVGMYATENTPGRSFVLCTVRASFFKDATSDAERVALRFVTNGATRTLDIISALGTAGALDQSMDLVFVNPIVIDVNTTISLIINVGTLAVGNAKLGGFITGYYRNKN